MKYFRNANFISWVGKDRQFYFFVGKGKITVGGSVNHGIKNLSPYHYDNVTAEMYCDTGTKAIGYYDYHYDLLTAWCC